MPDNLLHRSSSDQCVTHRPSKRNKWYHDDT